MCGRFSCFSKPNLTQLLSVPLKRRREISSLRTGRGSLLWTKPQNVSVASSVDKAAGRPGGLPLWTTTEGLQSWTMPWDLQGRPRGRGQGFGAAAGGQQDSNMAAEAEAGRQGGRGGLEERTRSWKRTIQLVYIKITKQFAVHYIALAILQ